MRKSAALGDTNKIRVARAGAHPTTEYIELKKDVDGVTTYLDLASGKPVTSTSHRFWIGDHITVRFITLEQANAKPSCCWPAHIWVDWKSDDAASFATRRLGRDKQVLPTVEWYAEFDTKAEKPIEPASARTPPLTPANAKAAQVNSSTLAHYLNAYALWIVGQQLGQVSAGADEKLVDLKDPPKDFNRAKLKPGTTTGKLDSYEANKNEYLKQT
jgi:hypothetical protein